MVVKATSYIRARIYSQSNQFGIYHYDLDGLLSLLLVSPHVWEGSLEKMATRL